MTSDASGTKKEPNWDEWLEKLTATSPDVRSEAAEGLVEICRVGNPPFERIVEALHDRIAMRNPGREKVLDVLQRMRAALRSIAKMRAQTEGLRVLRPKTPPPEGEGRLTWHVITKLWDVAVIYEDKNKLEETLSGATSGQRAMYAIWFSKSEIENGGYHQYYANSTGILALETALAFQLVGITALEKNHRATMKLFPRGEPPTDRSLRMKALEAIRPGAFGPYDEVFFDLSDGIFAATEAFILSNPREFFSDA